MILEFKYKLGSSTESKKFCNDLCSYEYNEGIPTVSEQHMKDSAEEILTSCHLLEIVFKAEDPFNTKLSSGRMHKIDKSIFIEKFGREYHLYNSFYPKNKLKSPDLVYIINKAFKWIFR